MDNGIRKRQNQENNIIYLAAQKQIYSETKNWNKMVCICSVILPFALSFIQIFAGNLHMFLYILSIMSWGISYKIKNKIEKDKENAAYIQQKFDVDVYQMPWNDYLFGKDKNVSGIVVEKSEKILQNESEKNSLKNWYVVEDTVELNEGILTCQRENVLWDIGLRKRYKIASLFVISILIITVFLISFIRNETDNVFFWLAFIMPLFQWICNTVEILDKDMERLEKLEEMMNSLKENTMINLQMIQREIFIHRKSCYAIPDFFYKLFKNNDEKRAQRRIQLK